MNPSAPITADSFIMDSTNQQIIDIHDESNPEVQVNSNSCPHLSSIDRKVLDFDFEKVCSVSLSKNNVYACLVCGKYYQGRGKSTHAFTHSIDESHHVFLNLETLKFYCLPDNYEIIDSSLSDILNVLKPSYSPDTIKKISTLTAPLKAYDGGQYYPGIVGLNNLKYNDYCNVVFQALSHVIPLRDYFLLETITDEARDTRFILALRFGELIRKLWNPNSFKTHVSPHEMLQAVVLTSKKRFEFTKQNDPIVFLGWLLNSLFGSKREKNSIIKQTFEGKVSIACRLLLPNIAAPTDSNGEPELLLSSKENVDVSSFLYLTLDLPTMPLFPQKDEKGKVIKPRISIHELLNKFDGVSQHEYRGYRETGMRRFELLKLPKYLILFYKRFTRNTFFTEKNTHIVDFNVNSLDMTPYISRGSSQDATKKCEYTLIANIIHDGLPDGGTYRIQALHRSTGKWFEIQDLYVTEMSDTTLITLSETYIQIWEQRSETSSN